MIDYILILMYMVYKIIFFIFRFCSKLGLEVDWAAPLPKPSPKKYFRLRIGLKPEFFSKHQTQARLGLLE